MSSIPSNKDDSVNDARKQLHSLSLDIINCLKDSDNADRDSKLQLIIDGGNIMLHQHCVLLSVIDLNLVLTCLCCTRAGKSSTIKMSTGRSFNINKLIEHINNKSHDDCKVVYQQQQAQTSLHTAPTNNMDTFLAEKSTSEGIKLELGRLICSYCIEFSKAGNKELKGLSVLPTDNAAKAYVIAHINSNQHKQNKMKQLQQRTLTSFIRNAPLSAVNFEPARFACLCFGLYCITDEERVLLTSGVFFEREEASLFNIEAGFRITITNKKTGKKLDVAGCFRHRHCLRVTTSADAVFSNFSCEFCASLRSGRIGEQFRRRVASANIYSPQTNIQFLTPDQMKGRYMKTQHEKVGLALQMHTLKRSMKRIGSTLSLTKMVKKQLKMSGTNEKVVSVVGNLLMATTQMRDISTARGFGLLFDMCNNIIIGKKRKVYGTETKAFAMNLLAYGGAKAAELYHREGGGPSVSTIRRTLKKTTMTGRGSLTTMFDIDSTGGCEQLMEATAAVYTGVLTKFGITSKVVFAFAEDETTCLPRVEYWRGKLRNFYGSSGMNGLAFASYEDVINIVTSPSNPLAKYITVVLCIPLHKDLPCLPIGITSSANEFKTNDVASRWERICQLALLHLTPVFGTAPLGFASDGDSRRVSLQLSQMRSILPDSCTAQKWTIDWAGMLLHGIKRLDGTVGFIHQQDFIHCIKKLYSSTFSYGRTLVLGKGNVAHQLLVELQQATPGGLLELGLGLNDVDRRDRQNLASVLRCISGKVRLHLRTLAKTSPSADNFLVTASYFQLISHYGLIFAGSHMAMSRRIEMAGYVLTFLATWYAWLKKIKVLTSTVEESFMTRNAFVDCYISVVSFLLTFKYCLLVYQGDGLKENLSVVVSQLGKYSSDCVELYFSMLGGYGTIKSNVRSITVLDCMHKTRLYLAIAQAKPPALAKHHKYELTALVREQVVAKDTVCDVLCEESLIASLKNGEKEALVELAELGVMLPKEMSAWDIVNADFFAKIVGEEVKDPNHTSVVMASSDKNAPPPALAEDEPEVDDEDQPLLEDLAMALDLDDSTVTTSNNHKVDEDHNNNSSANNNDDDPAGHVLDNKDSDEVVLEPQANDQVVEEREAIDTLLKRLQLEGDNQYDGSGTDDNSNAGFDITTEDEERQAISARVRGDASIILDSRPEELESDCAFEDGQAGGVHRQRKQKSKAVEKDWKDVWHVTDTHNRQAVHIHRLCADINSLLVDNHVSADRLTRIQNHASREVQLAVGGIRNETTMVTANVVGIGSCVAFSFVDPLVGVIFYIGQVQKIFYIVADKRKFVLAPVPLLLDSDDSKKYSYVCNWFIPTTKSKSCRTFIRDDVSSIVPVSHTVAITVVFLKRTETGFIISEEELATINTELKNATAEALAVDSGKKRKKTIESNGEDPSDGPKRYKTNASDRAKRAGDPVAANLNGK